MPRKCDNKEWTKCFGKILNKLKKLYGISDRFLAPELGCSEATIRYWKIGRNLPDIDLFNQLQRVFFNHVIDDSNLNQKTYDAIFECINEVNYGQAVAYLHNHAHTNAHFICDSLVFCYEMAKGETDMLNKIYEYVPATGKTKVVMFDFDGTLTTGSNKTTWEELWVKIGYSTKDCQELHAQYLEHKITHPEWTEETKNKFIERKMTRKDVEAVARKIKTIKGIRKTFVELEKRGIMIYIVSGSIRTIIKTVLKKNIQFVEMIKANEFQFDDNDYLCDIIETTYDFEGKARFVNEISSELHISPRDILFVGNSINDQFVSLSGASTLCINPQHTDYSNKTVWNNYIQTCEDLTEILKFVH